MQNEISKNLTQQLPDQVAAVNQFHDTLEIFFDCNDAEGHIKTLTELCLAFLGKALDQLNIDRTAIANMVFSANGICQFLRDVDYHYWNGKDINEKENSIIDGLIGNNGVLSLTGLIQDALQDWIIRYDVDRSIEYLQLATSKFKIISELIRVCNKIHLVAVNDLTKEGEVHHVKS